jgi:glyoxylase-like metal-dependent hydrolase (beta-lactamase superfamily II)
VTLAFRDLELGITFRVLLRNKQITHSPLTTPADMRLHRPAFAALVLSLIAPQLGPAQQVSVLESYQRARRVLDAAAVAMGGVEKVRGINSVMVRHEGRGFWRNQSPSATGPAASTATQGLLIIDFQNGRLFWDNATAFPGGFDNRNQLMISPREGWGANPYERRWFSVPNPNINNNRNLLRRLPHYFIVDALERTSHLRWLGEATWRGKRQQVVTYSASDGQQFTLFFDAGTHLLTKYEQLFTDAQAGDAVLEVIWPGYRLVDGVQVPTGRILRRVNEDAEEVRFTEFAINPPLPDSLFQKPAGYVDGTGGPVGDTAVVKLADDVYVVPAGGNNALVVGFSDHVMVVEAYGNDAISRRIIARVKELIPGKPIRYMVATHHHDDHTGGVRTYIAEGAAIVTTPGNREYFERMSRGVYTLVPDALSQNPKPLKLEMVTGKRRVFSDGTHEVQVIDIGPSPHANEMLVVYLPREKVLVQGDLLNLPVGRIRAGNLTTAHFAQWLERSGLQVEKIVPVHGPIHTPAELRQAIQLMQ